MKKFITLFAVLFLITFATAKAGEKFPEEDLSSRYLRDIEKLSIPQDIEFNKITNFIKVNEKHSLLKNKKKSDELQSDKYLPSV
nr:hypothetical protein [Candidatus Kapabacteria bacterium]